MARILAVDDSRSMQQLIGRTLSSGGHCVQLAGDGLEALHAANHSQFDLVIADADLRGIDGLTLVRELRGRSNYRFVPLFMLTAEPTIERTHQGRAAGATGWLFKPIDPDRLLVAVARALL